jgi:exosome complex RNA-binding protein Rrp42 (RNase PH superfamily)
LIILNEDGNLVDACFIAAVACLLNTKLPEVTISSPQKIRINNTKVRNLNVHHIPVCTSFYFIEGVASTQPIVDVNSKEEKLSKARLSVCMNIFEDLCGMTTFGSLQVSAPILSQCTQIALGITKEITIKLREARHENLSLLDFSHSSSTSHITQSNKSSA